MPTPSQEISQAASQAVDNPLSDAGTDGFVPINFDSMAESPSYEELTENNPSQKIDYLDDDFDHVISKY